jgi:2-oxoglutarate ferredoxin oxidoreductase subunit alpha
MEPSPGVPSQYDFKTGVKDMTQDVMIVERDAASENTPATAEPRQSVSLAIVGSGGAGVMTIGEILLSAAARAGRYGLMMRSNGPQIRGGEAAALITVSAEPARFYPESFDFLLALDWQNVERFAAEITLTQDSLVLGDSAHAEKIPTFVRDSGATIEDVGLKALADSLEGGRVNMVALGILAAMLDLPRPVIESVIADKLFSKGDAAIASSTAGARLGMGTPEITCGMLAVAAIESPGEDRWLISGNEAVGLGALRGGVRFAAAYPITPATEILEWLAPSLARIGGTLVQAEDELASINMAIGASFGGIPAMTATSGPGLALMAESLGLAVAAEIPVVVIDVMRVGPSTGIATKSEQGDLNIAIHGLHGDAPHIVLAPYSVEDCVFAAQWAVCLAEATQGPVIVLSDQFLGQARAVVDRPPDLDFFAARRIATEFETGYSRYALEADGISPMAIPGIPGGQYTADGLVHNERGTPSSQAEDHVAQLTKRRRKIEEYDYGAHWAVSEGDGPFALITWGSCAGPVLEAAHRARRAGIDLRTIIIRLLSPTQPDAMARLLEGVESALIVEQNATGQLYHYLRAQYDLPPETESLNQPGPLPVPPSEILSAIEGSMVR